MIVQSRIASADPAWKLVDAKAHLSEVISRARDVGPQRVTVSGRAAVVVIAVEEYDHLCLQAEQRSALDLFAGLEKLGELEIERDRDAGRNIEFN